MKMLRKAKSRRWLTPSTRLAGSALPRQAVKEVGRLWLPPDTALSGTFCLI